MRARIRFTETGKRYYLEGKEVDKATFDAACPSKQVEGKIGVPSFRMPDTGWENENGGRGRYISQLADKGPGVTDPDAYCRSRHEITEKARKAGFQTIEKS